MSKSLIEMTREERDELIRETYKDDTAQAMTASLVLEFFIGLEKRLSEREEE